MVALKKLVKKWRITIYNAARTKVCLNKLMHSAACVLACAMRLLSWNSLSSVEASQQMHFENYKRQK